VNLFTTLHADTRPPRRTDISIPCGVLLLLFISSIKFTAGNYRYSPPPPTPCHHGWNENSEKQIKRWLSVSIYIYNIYIIHRGMYLYTITIRNWRKNRSCSPPIHYSINKIFIFIMLFPGVYESHTTKLYCRTHITMPMSKFKIVVNIGMKYTYNIGNKILIYIIY